MKFMVYNIKEIYVTLHYANVIYIMSVQFTLCQHNLHYS